MTSKTVVIFGAGATKACGGPLTDEILPQAFDPGVRSVIERESYIYLLDEFLIEIFHLPRHPDDRTKTDYPALPLLLSLVDKAINNNQPMGPNWTVDKLRNVRRGLQYMIFALLEYRLRHFNDYYLDFLNQLDRTRKNPPTVISLNYDIIVDNALMQHSGCLPSYGCDIATEGYKSRQRQCGGILLKIHGSLNWSYCPGCNRLDLGVAESGSTYKMLNELYRENPLEERYSCHGFPCPECATNVEPILITPTQMKDYRNPHVTRVWHLAEQALRNAERLYIIGYSLPDDDLDVIYLLKRGLGQLVNRAPQNITVVEKDNTRPSISNHSVGRRYRSILGPHFDWRTDGFEGLIASLKGGVKHRGKGRPG